MENTERFRLRYEVFKPKEKKPGLDVVGAILLVSNPGITGEALMDLGKRQPYRNELKASLERLKVDFGR